VFSTLGNTEYGDVYKIENTDFADAAFRRTIQVTPNTKYRVTALARMEGYVDGGENAALSGAAIAIESTWESSKRKKDGEWERLELVFNSGNSTTVTIDLRNGAHSGTNSGTAWFTDVTVEKNDATPGNSWDFLFVIYKNVDAVASDNGKRYKFSLRDRDVNDLRSYLALVPDAFKTLSGGLMTVGTVDVRVVESTLTTLSGDGSSFHVMGEKSIDEYMALREYDQVLSILPIIEFGGGLGGGSYRGAGYAEAYVRPGSVAQTRVHPEAVYVHETLHCIESRARSMGYEVSSLHPEETSAALHDYYERLDDDWYTWYRDFMRDTRPEIHGLPPEVYTVYHGDYKTLPYYDIDGGWAYDSIYWAYENGLIDGENGLFTPNAPALRSAIVTALYRLAKPQGYADAVEWGLAQGILQGYGNGELGLGNTVTREQFATFVYRFVSPADAGAQLAFTDNGSVSDWARDAVSWAYGEGLVNGYPDGSFKPQGVISRAEVAAILQRLTA
jgi:hypothetical protein